MTRDELIEKVAEAICPYTFSQDAVESVGIAMAEEGKKMARRQAIAAIHVAMEEAANFVGEIRLGMAPTQGADHVEQEMALMSIHTLQSVEDGLRAIGKVND
jgi:hypothetical protein